MLRGGTKIEFSDSQIQIFASLTFRQIGVLSRHSRHSTGPNCPYHGHI